MEKVLFHVMFAATIAILVGLMLFVVFVMVPNEKVDYQAKRQKARIDCVEGGGKIKDAHGGSAFTAEWYCEGAKP